MVAVDKAPAQVTAQVPPDRGLATAGHAHEGNAQGHATLPAGTELPLNMTWV
jgi:hypothetical protein